MKTNNQIRNYFWRLLERCHSLSNWLQKRDSLTMQTTMLHFCTTQHATKVWKRLFLNVNCTKILDIKYFSHIHDSHWDKFHCLLLTWRWKTKKKQKRTWTSGKAYFQLLKNHKRKYSWDLRHMIISIKMLDFLFVMQFSVYRNSLGWLLGNSTLAVITKQTHND